MNQDVQKKIEELEALTQQMDFWADKFHAQEVIRELQELKSGKNARAGGEYDHLPTVITIFAGAGGDDAEDFASILFRLYRAFAERRGWPTLLVHEHTNDHGGYRNVTFDLVGKGAYGILKHESGVHRLVRISPYDANKRRHTSFAMVEVIPKFGETEKLAIPEQELAIEFARSSGPGGQNVNKRETSVRLTHVPTGITVHCESERTQQANTRRALEILRGKLYKRREEERVAKERSMYVSRTTENEWGSQIRSYVLHPYKMVKDHRTGAETGNVDAVLAGDIDLFLEAEKSLGS